MQTEQHERLRERERATQRRGVDQGAAAAFRAQLWQRLESGVEERLDQLADAGDLAKALGDPAGVADRMIATLPVVRHDLDVELGPFYDTAGLSAWWGVSRQALSDRVRRGTLLACRTGDGHLVYPAFQFARDGSVRPGILEAVAVFQRHTVDGWTAAVWLTSPSPGLDGDSAVDYLVVHRASAAAVRRVAQQAAADAAAWAA